MRGGGGGAADVPVRRLVRSQYVYVTVGTTRTAMNEIVLMTTLPLYSTHDLGTDISIEAEFLTRVRKAFPGYEQAHEVETFVIHSFFQFFVHLIVCSLIYSFIHSSIHSFIHSIDQ